MTAAPLPDPFGIIAGNGVYPLLLARAARRAGVRRIVAAAFEGETSPELAAQVDDIRWLRVGQLGRLIAVLAKSGAAHAVMAGQIAPRNLFDLRPDVKALVMLARLKRRNAETIFGAIADELAAAGVTLLPATTFLEDCLVPDGHVCGPPLRARDLDDARFGFRIARAVCDLDIGQTVVVKHGSVLAVEAFEGTDDALRRGGSLGRGAAIAVKVSKRNQDFRFDVPVIGARTIETAAEAGVRAVVAEAGRTLLLERERVVEVAAARRVSVRGIAGGEE